MKRNCSNKIKSIIAIIKKSFIAVSLVSISLFANGCNLVKYKHRPFRLNQSQVLFEDNDNNLYFEHGNGSTFLCKYSFNDKNHRQLCQLYDGDEFLNYDCGVSNSEYLFICAQPANINLPSFIEIIDKSFKCVAKIMLEENEQLIDMACNERFLYFLKKNTDTKKYSLIRSDSLANSLTVLLDDLGGLSNYQDDDINLFFCNSDTEPYMGKYDQITPLIHSYVTLFTDKLDLRVTYDSLIITNSGTKYSFKKDRTTSRFYKKAYLIDNKVLFATYNNVKNNECGSDNNLDGSCLCGMKESYLYIFDTLTNELNLIHSYDVGTFLIDYDLSEVRHYYNGGLYVNDCLVRECETIKADPPEKVDYFAKLYHKFDYDVSYYKNSFYGI